MFDTQEDIEATRDEKTPIGMYIMTAVALLVLGVVMAGSCIKKILHQQFHVVCTYKHFLYAALMLVTNGSTAFVFAEPGSTWWFIGLTAMLVPVLLITILYICSFYLAKGMDDECITGV